MPPKKDPLAPIKFSVADATDDLFNEDGSEKAEEKPVALDRRGRPLTSSQLAYRDRRLRRPRGYYDPVLGRRVEFDEQ